MRECSSAATVNCTFCLAKNIILLEELNVIYLKNICTGGEALCILKTTWRMGWKRRCKKYNYDFEAVFSFYLQLKWKRNWMIWLSETISKDGHNSDAKTTLHWILHCGILLWQTGSFSVSDRAKMPTTPPPGNDYACVVKSARQCPVRGYLQKEPCMVDVTCFPFCNQKC